MQRSDGSPPSAVDALGRTTGQLYRDGGRVTYTFDANGRTTTMGDVTGITSYEFNQAGQQTQVRYPGVRTL